MWLLTTALAGMPNTCAPPSVLPFLEDHIAVGDYLRAGNHPLAVKQVVREGDTVMLWVECRALMGELNQLVAWKTGDAPMEAVGLGYRGSGLDRWFGEVELSLVDVGWPESRAVQVHGTFAQSTDQMQLHSDDMVVWVVGYPAFEERRRFGDIPKGPRHGEGCDDPRLPDGRQTEVWLARSARARSLGWPAEATLASTHRWADDVLEVEERWTHTDGTVVRTVHRTLGWAYGGLHETCRVE